MSSTASNFDIAAFLDTPSNIDAFNNESLSDPMSHSMGDGLTDAFGFSNSTLVDNSQGAMPFLPEWASSSTDMNGIGSGSENFSSSVLGSSTSQTPVTSDASTDFKPNSYRAKLAAHHSAQLRDSLPPNGGSGLGHMPSFPGPGQRSQTTGNFNTLSAPQRPAVRPSVLNSKNASTMSDLTIQERRRLARRSRTFGEHSAPAPQPTQSAQQVTAQVQRMAPQASSMDTQMQSSEIIPTVSNMHNNPPVEQGNVISSDFVSRAYSSTGFDLVGALLRVASRPNPKIDIGPVDLSCSFTVSDARHPDQPIVHCSDSFCNLTGYDRAEVIGRNCRFLQSPKGQIEAGAERMDTDNGAVQHIKKNLSRMHECQVSLINYRKNGTPFINLVTIVPITWGDSTEPVFFVGFQVDLIEQPGAILDRKANGIYTVNYSQSNPHPSSMHVLKQSQDMDSALVAFDAAEAEANKRSMLASELADMIDSGKRDDSPWARVLLENSHDIIHVLSLKGTFLYVSPSVERILGYKPEELIGKSISEFCHPSDVVPVFRELKDSTSNASIAAAARHWARVDGTVNPPTKGGAGQTGPQVNLVMRMKHKHHGHEWIENVGKLHLEQGKGRKVVISTGRQRPMYNLPWEQARRSLNSRAPGFWIKLSSGGLILGTSGSASEVIEGGSPTTEHLVPLRGKHIKDLVDEGALQAILSALKGLQVSAVPHMMSNGVGGPAQAVISTIIPSSAGGVGLPAVFVYTQRADPQDYSALQQNATYCQEANAAAHDASQAATLKVGEPSPGSVFGELSTSRSSSWVFELHQLKNANKRLREELRARQRRASGRRASLVAPISPSKSKRHPQLPSTPTVTASTPADTTMAAPPVHMSASSKLSAHNLQAKRGISLSCSSSQETSLSPLRSDSQSGTDSTGRTSVSTEAGSNVAAGVKRSRS